MNNREKINRKGKEDRALGIGGTITKELTFVSSEFPEGEEQGQGAEKALEEMRMHNGAFKNLLRG